MRVNTTYWMNIFFTSTLIYESLVHVVKPKMGDLCYVAF